MLGWVNRLFQPQVKSATSGFVNPIKVELHSHLIPSIDDGVQSFEESIAVIKHFANNGYTKVITTPHIMGDFYKNGPENILPALENIRKELKMRQINIEVDAAAEYMVDDLFLNKISQGNLLTFGKNKVLIELPFTEEPTVLKSALFELQVAGYTPVLAHPERYAFLAHQKSKYEELFDQGILMQLNLFSLIGYYSPQVQKTAEYLIKQKMVHFIGSDCHGVRHLRAFNDALVCLNYEQVCNLPLLNNEL